MTETKDISREDYADLQVIKSQQTEINRRLYTIENEVKQVLLMRKDVESNAAAIIANSDNWSWLVKGVLGVVLAAVLAVVFDAPKILSGL